MCSDHACLYKPEHGDPVLQVNESLTDMAFLNCRPSVIAAAVIYAERRARGIIPFWPSMLAKLSGYDNMSTPELSVAIKVRAALCLIRPLLYLLLLSQCTLPPTIPQARSLRVLS